MTIRESGYAAIGMTAGLILVTIASALSLWTWWAFLAALGILCLYLMWVANYRRPNLTQYREWTAEDVRKTETLNRLYQWAESKQKSVHIRGRVVPLSGSPGASRGQTTWLGITGTEREERSS